MGKMRVLVLYSFREKGASLTLTLKNVGVQFISKNPVGAIAVKSRSKIQRSFRVNLGLTATMWEPQELLPLTAAT